ncbi:MAG TPA: aminotransferase class I/II-fold pyridoxal phosphate-dependent enzyme [Gemmatimonadales bacterium]|jgi:histidinol-phosphate aminotransferase|nr:aminotransferase class I/II-fold pyridoxal phosphate-dependent enzyme [Gemmatimonadales bacterium]
MSILRLNSNEGPRAPQALLAELAALDPELLRRYPDATAVETALAARTGVSPERVVVTAGADEALDRICRAYAGPDRPVLLPEPTFDMLQRFAALAGAPLVRVPWCTDAFPLEEILARLDNRIALVVIVSPNNPTGGVASRDDVRRIAAAAPRSLVLLDQAYIDYADEDIGPAVLDLANVVVVRTMSKAWGLAGCRVGYAVGSSDVIAVLRAAGGPYPVAGPSLALALSQLRHGDAALRAHVTEVSAERAKLREFLCARGTAARASQANFVLADLGRRQAFVRDGLRAQGILVRDFPGRAGLETSLRITLPGDPADFERLTSALDTVLAPEALVFDLDGVLADVRESQRAAMIATAGAYGVTVTMEDIEDALRAGDAANDWIVTQRLITARGVQADLATVTARFQALYLGAAGSPGLRERERLIEPRALLERFAKRLPLAVVTGRPRDEARWFLERQGLANLFRAVVCMEDAARKPDPAPVRLALTRLGARRAWMVGNTPDDVRAAAGADVLPFGVVAPGDDFDATAAALADAGAARVLDRLADLEELLP